MSGSNPSPTDAARELRHALGCFVTGVAVVTSLEPDATPRGFTVNSFSSVSLDPPLVSVCIDHRAASLPVFRNCAGFAVNVLAEQQRDVSDLFASKAPDKFERVGWHPGARGTPLLDGAVAFFDCEPFERIEAGDHLMLIGRVREFGYGDGRPLGFCRGNYITFGLEQAAVLHQPGRRVRAGCILERDERILLLREAGRWSLPLERDAGGASHARLQDVLAALGVEASIGFLFSVFDGPGAAELSVFYRGSVLNDPVSEVARLFDFDAIPWSDLPCDADRVMLRRYIEERRRFEFGIYVGSAEAGAVARLAGSDEH